jgi:hypothetical protein
LLRIFANKPVDITKIDEPNIKSMSGVWAKQTAGGPRVDSLGKLNHFWFAND